MHAVARDRIEVLIGCRPLWGLEFVREHRGSVPEEPNAACLVPAIPGLGPPEPNPGEAGSGPGTGSILRSRDGTYSNADRPAFR